MNEITVDRLDYDGWSDSPKQDNIITDEAELIRTYRKNGLNIGFKSIAFGFSAYLKKYETDVKENTANLIPTVFSEYYELRKSIYYKLWEKSISPIEKVKLLDVSLWGFRESVFIEDHLKKELDNLHKSDIYFTEIAANKDELIKGTKTYVDAYILWLEQLPCRETVENTKADRIVTSSDPKEDSTNKITMREIALICVYQKEDVTKNNADVIAKGYGLQSGAKLYHYFCQYSKRSNRIGKEDSQAKNKNKRNLLNKVIDSLPVEKQKLAMAEFQLFLRNASLDT